MILDEFDQRRDPKLYYLAIKARLEQEFAAHVPEADAKIFGPPPVQGLGTAGGWKVMIEDRSDSGLAALQKQTQNIVTLANAPVAPPKTNSAPQKTDAAPKAAESKPTAPQPSKPSGPAPEAPHDPAAVAQAQALLTKTFTLFTVKYPQLYVDVNRDQCHTMGLNPLRRRL